MRDRFIRGLLAGLAGGLAAVAVHLVVSFGFGFGKLHFYDISGVMIFGHRPQTTIEALFAEIGHLGLSSTVGIALTYLMPKLKSSYLWIKGLFVGGAVWFAVFAVTVLYNVAGVKETDLPSATVNLISSLVYGLVTVWVLRRLDRTVARG